MAGSKPKNKGKRVGRLVCQELVTINGKRKWRCLCDCGNTHYVTSGNLSSKQVKSCGCLADEFVKGQNRAWASGAFVGKVIKKGEHGGHGGH